MHLRCSQTPRSTVTQPAAAAGPHLLICELLAQVGHHVSQLQQGRSQSISRPAAGVRMMSCRATVT